MAESRDISIIARLEKQVASALGRAGYCGNDTTLVVAVSGGPDSSALLYSLDRLRAQHRLQLQVAHLNHDFRGEEADADARFVASLAQELGLSVTVAKLDPQEYQRQRHISSFEQAARELRYAFLAGVAQEVGAAAVALGHTADDLAETVLLHLLRGTGLPGLRGMTELSPWPWATASPPDPLSIRDGEGVATPGVRPLPLKMFRPLLGVTKADTVAYCRALGRSYREDPGNYLPQFTRNRVRHELLPLLGSQYNPRIRESLVRLARTVALELDYLAGEVARAWPEVATEAAESVSFDRACLAALHPLLQRLLLRRGYATLVGDTRRLEEIHLIAMAELIAAPSSRSLDLPLGLRLHSIYDRLVLCRAGHLPCPFPPLEGEYPLALPASEDQEALTEIAGWRVTVQIVTPLADLPPGTEASGGLKGQAPPGLTAYFDRDSLGDRLYVRTRGLGDRFQPLGLAQAKKLQDFFTDAKVPRLWRDRVPLLVSDRGIAWVVGYRIADWAKVVQEKSPGPAAVCLRVSLEGSKINLAES